MKIVSHTIVKNEDQWIWFAIKSVIDYVDEMLIWDTGSTDNTVSVINSIKSSKIKFKSIPCNTPEEVTQGRQAMWNQSKGDWVLILDGDEIWPLNSLLASINIAQNTNKPYIINRSLNLVGDVYHYQEDNAGRYVFGKRKGHLTTRFLNFNHLKNSIYHRGYPDESLLHPSGVPIQQYLPDIMPYSNDPYLHATHLLRSSGTARNLHAPKFKYELGIPINENFVYPKSFYETPPPQVPSPWKTRSFAYILNSLWQTPLKKISRLLNNI